MGARLFNGSDRSFYSTILIFSLSPSDKSFISEMLNFLFMTIFRYCHCSFIGLNTM